MSEYTPTISLDLPRECWTCGKFDSCGLTFGCNGAQWTPNHNALVVNSSNPVPSVHSGNSSR